MILDVPLIPARRQEPSLQLALLCARYLRTPGSLRRHPRDRLRAKAPGVRESFDSARLRICGFRWLQV